MAANKQHEKKSYHHGGLKQVLLDETARILREEGESGLSLRRLAANLGVSRTAPYNHFKNKDELLSAVAEHGFERYEQAIAAVRKKNKNRGGQAITRAHVTAYVKFARDNREYYDLMYGSKPWRQEKPTKSLASTARGILRSDVERLKRGQERGQIAKNLDVVQFSRMYLGTLHGISRLLLNGVYTNDASIKKLCHATADMLWHQMKPDGIN